MIAIQPFLTVMGVTYSIDQKTEDDAMFKKYSSLSGYCDYTSKRIVYDPNDGCDADVPVRWVPETVRHEIVHAFMNECGLSYNWEHKPMGHEETDCER